MMLESLGVRIGLEMKESMPSGGLSFLVKLCGLFGLTVVPGVLSCFQCPACVFCSILVLSVSLGLQKDRPPSKEESV